MSITFDDGVEDSGTTPAASTHVVTLLPRITASLPGCPSPVRLMALRQAARDFCRETEVWREILTTTSTEDEDEYDLTDLHTWDALIERVRAVRLDSSTVDEGDYEVSEDGVLTFDTAPDADDYAIEADVVFLPLDECEDYPTWLIGKWSDAIQTKALMLLKAMPQKPWSDPKGAADLEREYVYQCGLAKVAVTMARKGGDLTAQAPTFV